VSHYANVLVQVVAILGVIQVIAILAVYFQQRFFKVF